MTWSAPWDISLRQRLSMLRADTHRVAYFAPGPDSGSFRYRCYNAAQAINATGAEVSATYFFQTDLDHLDNLSDFADTLVVFRAPYDTEIERLIGKFRQSGKKIFFDIDDLIFDNQFTPLVASNLNYKPVGKDVEAWFSLIANVGSCLNLCDAVITTNDYLARRIHDFSQLPVSVIPNFVNKEQISVSEALLRRKKQRPPGPGLRLGYFSGSHSHAKDFEVAKSGILAFMEASPHSTLTILGHLELSPELESLGTRLIQKPFVNFLGLQDEISQVDVNLVPLQVSPFTFSKSELKFFEAALVGTITLATPTPVYEKAITDGVNGFLSGAAVWRRKLTEIEELSEDKHRLIASRAWDTAMKNFSWEAMNPKLAALFLDAN